MARNTGRHHVSRGAKLTAGVTGVLLVAGLAVALTTRDSGTAQADGADKSSFVDITTVQPNVKQARQRGGASRGTFTVDCGRNENRHFNPDNFIAQPGVKNGAQHLHDYVGNLSTEADTTNETLANADTTCENGDKSAYYWPVLRIDTDDEADAVEAEQPAPVKPAAPAVACPDVASMLGDVPDQAQAEVEQNLALLDQQVDEANKRVEAEKANKDPNFVAVGRGCGVAGVGCQPRGALAVGARSPRGRDARRPLDAATRLGADLVVPPPFSCVPKPFNRATHAALTATLRAYTGITNRWRTTELGLPARKGHVYGYEPGGTRLFDVELGGPVDSYPALTADGALLVGSRDGVLTAIA